MNTPENRSESVFIKESNARARQRIINALITNIGLFAVILIPLSIVLFSYYKLSFKLLCSGGAAAAYILVTALAVRSILKRKKEFEGMIFFMDDEEFDALNRQALKADKFMKVFYMLDDCVYVSSEDMFIPYKDIKSFRYYNGRDSKSHRFAVMGITLRDGALCEIHGADTSKKAREEFEAALGIRLSEAMKKAKNSRDN